MSSRKSRFLHLASQVVEKGAVARVVVYGVFGDVHIYHGPYRPPKLEPARNRPPERDGHPDPEPTDNRFTYCMRDVFSALKDAGHRLTFKKVFAGANSYGREWSERSVQRALKMLQNAGVHNLHGQGFGLDSWAE